MNCYFQIVRSCMQVSYYSLVPRLTHLAFGALGACAVLGAGGPSLAAAKVGLINTPVEGDSACYEAAATCKIQPDA